MNRGTPKAVRLASLALGTALVGLAMWPHSAPDASWKGGYDCYTIQWFACNVTPTNCFTVPATACILQNGIYVCPISEHMATAETGYQGCTGAATGYVTCTESTTNVKYCDQDRTCACYDAAGNGNYICWTDPSGEVTVGTKHGAPSGSGTCPPPPVPPPPKNPV